MSHRILNSREYFSNEKNDNFGGKLFVLEEETKSNFKA
jgi:hypothetical protein